MKILQGIGVSGGKVEGIARVAANYKEAKAMEEGEILIAKETDQWYVVYLNEAKAIVTENGTAKSHAAKIAAKLGIPAVVGVQGLMGEIQTGYKLRVDGTTGEVRVLSTRFHEIVH